MLKVTTPAQRPSCWSSGRSPGSRRARRRPPLPSWRASAWLDGNDSDRFATALVVHIDVPTRTATVASAGHLAPALLSPTPTGTVPSALELETGPPLGIGQEWHDRSTQLPADAVLFLFTDGLVETRVDDIDEGVRRLGELLEGLPFDARTILHSALELHPGEDEDDVAVLVAHVP
ncbi:serine/threonine-protein phosphatase [Nocardioides panacis]|uniref:Serine/threonine-protein phosphatase n=1 Tax=Nocardioides panacis TaxID=2849501 RepID=A0A975SXQ8_9ACTN|nr:PP2C family protein-serine/threonine phosphatase [Nocardioides panacis]QWZ07365.1 serine/threonine-protein phosphatase [Nocardioides panacis]